ncbi:MULTISPECIES: hypothetical protein [unclassified Mameliella]|uniref:hypothetical protein n=1 Tax=Mameliella sp. LZ-28 TaxID=2484146 RepID=UPI00143F83F6|nr:hypothetical protein [Mameliella sp. LZ-28]
MSILSKPKQGGRHHSAEVVCDQCGTTETVVCDYAREAGGSWAPNMGQINKKITQNGWAILKKKHSCPKCEKERKAVLVTETAVKTKPQETQAAPEPTKAQKREIMLALEDYYDTETERYKSGNTDQVLADLCGVMPGFVAKIREEFFGPDGGNEDIEALTARIEDLRNDVDGLMSQARDMSERAETLRACAEAKLAEIGTVSSDLARVKKAVGPAALHRAGVKA